jgi:hypothetical protein
VCSDRSTQRDQAIRINLIGLLLVDTGRPYEAEAEYSTALAIRRELARDHTTPTRLRSLLAQVHTNLGRLQE